MTLWRAKAKPALSVEELLPRLQDRDVRIVLLLGRYKVFTLAQLAALFFTSASSARDRINTLTELGVLRRFRPASTRAAYRYALAHVGRCLYAVSETNTLQFDIPKTGEGEIKMPSRRKSEHALLRLASSSHRAHTEAINEFFVRLILGLRAKTTATGQQWLLGAWVPESHDGGYGQSRPDGAGTLVHPDGRLMTFWFEHDTGTEPLSTLVRKVNQYEHDLSRRQLLLFQLPSAARQAHFHHALRDDLPQRFVAATTVTTPDADPAAHVWWICGRTPKSLRRIDDIVYPRDPEPKNPFDEIRADTAFYPPPEHQPEPERNNTSG